MRRVFRGAYEDNVAFLASALAFEALLWTLPFLLVALAIFGFIVGGSQPEQEVRGLLVRVLPATPQEGPFTRVTDALVAVVESRARLSIWAAPFFVFFSLRLFGSVRNALNDVFDTDETRSWIVAKATDFLLAVTAAVLIAANTLTSVVVLDASWPGRFAATVSAYGFAVLLFFIIYTTAPGRRVGWDTGLVAAVVVSLGFELVKRLFGVYLARFATFDRVVSNANAIGLLLFVLWIYLIAFIFVAGGEVAQAYDLTRRQREQRAVLG
ncbi:MAG TPA: YihY/virulence factor BrkB family protein [Gemmatimonadales bacterium]|nr:YihY/virulence factor BrkB family protein [Gemmatimonadales bacterium]